MFRFLCTNNVRVCGAAIAAADWSPADDVTADSQSAIAAVQLIVRRTVEFVLRITIFITKSNQLSPRASLLAQPTPAAAAFASSLLAASPLQSAHAQRALAAMCACAVRTRCNVCAADDGASFREPCCPRLGYGMDKIIILLKCN